MDLSVERGVVRCNRQVRRGNDQFPRFDRLRAEVYRFDQWRLGRQTVRRPDEGTRLRGENVSFYRQESRGGARRQLRRLHGQLDPRPHEPVQMHRVARRHVQRGVGLRHDRGAVVYELGIRRSALEKTGCLSEMVAARVRGEFQHASARLAWATRLPPQCFARFWSIYDVTIAESPVEDVVFPRRRSLSAQAAKLPALVQDGERLGGSMVQVTSGTIIF